LNELEEIVKSKKDKFITNLNKVINLAREELDKSGSYGYLPEIIENLENMKQRIDADNKAKDSLIGAIGYLVTDSIIFSESKIGKRILDIINDFSKT